MANFKNFRSIIPRRNSVVLVNFLNTEENQLVTRISSMKFRKIGFSDSRTISKGSNNFVRTKIDALVKWYEEITGLDEVRVMQNRVIDAQNRFATAQEKRREATNSISSVQNKLKDIRSELDTTTKGEERYLLLITQEHTVLKEEKSCNIKFQLSEKEERDCFAFLSAAVKESHEKERAQAQKTKYWSVIGSVIGTLIGVIGSSINNEFKMKELRRLVQVSMEGNSTSIISQHETLQELVKEAVLVAQKKQGNSDIDDIVLHNLHDYHVVASVEQLLLQQRQETRIAVLLTVVVPLVCLAIQKFT